MISQLSEIPRVAKLDSILQLLELSKDWDGGSVSSTHCVMVWDVAPGYRFELSINPTPRDDDNIEVFEAGFAAQNKPGFPLDEFHTVYPCLTTNGIAYE